MEASTEVAVTDTGVLLEDKPKETDSLLMADPLGLCGNSSFNFVENISQSVFFAQYPDIQKAFGLTHQLRLIFLKIKDKANAYTKLARWYNDVTESGFKSFNTISASIYTHYKEILSFFDNRSTNASAESFNAKLKAFRATLRGVTDTNFFLFRVAKIFA